MELTSLNTIKNLLAKYDTRPSKGLGQNFLIDKNVLQKIITCADIKPTDIVLEVGPGIGTLTQELAKKAKKVIAVEKDDTMIEVLKETLKNLTNVEVENCDILEFIENWKLKIKNYKVIANIPYYLTSPLIRKLLEAENKPDFMVLMVQKEVAQRICAKIGDMNLLAVSVQFYATPKIISFVKKGCFYPSPKIDSAIIKITPTKKPAINPEEFFKVVKAGFSHPRKQLLNNFSTTLDIEKEKITKWLLKNNIKPTQRAETLSIQNWESLTKTLPQ